MEHFVVTCDTGCPLQVQLACDHLCSIWIFLHRCEMCASPFAADASAKPPARKMLFSRGSSFTCDECYTMDGASPRVRPLESSSGTRVQAPGLWHSIQSSVFPEASASGEKCAAHGSHLRGDVRTTLADHSPEQNTLQDTSVHLVLGHDTSFSVVTRQSIHIVVTLTLAAPL